jgi:hypothetical protein
MRSCRRCEGRILDDGSRRRTEWCQSIRRLLQLEAAQPEDYHQDCFIDAILEGGKPDTRSRRSRRTRDSPDRPLAPAPPPPGHWPL